MKVFMELNNERIDDLVDNILKHKLVEEKIKNIMTILNKPDNYVEKVMSNTKFFDKFMNTREEKLQLYLSYYSQVDKIDINAYNNICKDFIEKTKEKIFDFHEKNKKIPLDKETLSMLMENDEKNIYELSDENKFYSKLNEILLKEFHNHIEENIEETITSRISKNDINDMFRSYLEHEFEKAIKFVIPENKNEKKRKSTKNIDNSQIKKTKTETPQPNNNEDMIKKKTNTRTASEKAKTRIKQGRNLYENNKLDDDDHRLDFLEPDFD